MRNLVSLLEVVLQSRVKIFGSFSQRNTDPVTVLTLEDQFTGHISHSAFLVTQNHLGYNSRVSEDLPKLTSKVWPQKSKDIHKLRIVSLMRRTSQEDKSICLLSQLLGKTVPLSDCLTRQLTQVMSLIEDYKVPVARVSELWQVIV